MNTSKRRPGRGFTLVELLIVIIIITLLAALLIPTIIGAINNAKRGRIVMEITQLESAMETYKTQNGGEYPPDFSDTTTLIPRLSTHMRRAFPRHTLTFNSTTWAVSGASAYRRAGTYFGVTDPFYAHLDPSEALVFWLSQLANNPQDPLTPVGVPKTFFTFDTARFQDKDGDGWPEYYPRDSDACPYVYFEFHTYATGGLTGARYPYDVSYYSTTGLNNPAQNTVPVQGVARPYCTAVDPMTLVATAYVNPNKFQILFGGLDGDFGTDTYVLASDTGRKLFPAGGNYTAGDRDNLANFSDGRTLENNKP